MRAYLDFECGHGPARNDEVAWRIVCVQVRPRRSGSVAVEELRERAVEAGDTAVAITNLPQDTEHQRLRPDRVPPSPDVRGQALAHGASEHDPGQIRSLFLGRGQSQT